MTRTLRRPARWGIAPSVAWIACAAAAAHAGTRGGGWSAPAVLPSPAGTFLSDVHRLEDAFAAPDGSVHAVFVDRRGPARRWNRVLYARFDGRAWGRVEVIDDTPGRSHAPRVVVERGGGVHVLWIEGRDPGLPDAGTDLLHVRREDAGWSAPARVHREAGPRGMGDLQLAVAAAARGGERVLHSRGDGALAQGVLRGTAWRAAAAPGEPGGYVRWDRAGGGGPPRFVYVAARTSDARRSANNDLWVRTLGPAGWGEPAAVHVAPTLTHDPSLLTDDAGVVHAAWVEGSRSGRRERLLYASSRDGVRWTPARDAVPPAAGLDFGAPRLARGAGGRVHLTFLQLDSTGATPRHARLVDGRWTPARSIAPGELAGGLEMETVADAGGTLHTIWKGRDGRYRHARLASRDQGASADPPARRTTR